MHGLNLTLNHSRLENLKILETLRLNPPVHALSPDITFRIRALAHLQAIYSVPVDEALRIQQRYALALDTARQAHPLREALPLAQTLSCSPEEFSMVLKLMDLDREMGILLDPIPQAPICSQEVPNPQPATATPQALSFRQRVRINDEIQKYKRQYPHITTSIAHLRSQLHFHAQHWRPTQIACPTESDRIYAALMVAFSKLRAGTWQAPYRWVSPETLKREQAARQWKQGQLSHHGWRGNIKCPTRPQTLTEIFRKQYAAA
jgi:hypothetical protein